MDEVVAIFLALESPEECALFLSIMLTPQELDQIPVRWELLRMLMLEKMSQRKLAARAHVAPATAARASKAFRDHARFLRMMQERVAHP
jgi:Trp operon repressor